MAKPTLGTAINASNPLSSGLVGAFALFEGSGTAVGDQATGNAAEGVLSSSGSTPPTWAGVNDTGLAFAGGAALASYVALGSVAALQDRWLDTSHPGSIFIKGRMGATNTAGGLVGRNDSNAADHGWQVLLGAGPTLHFISEASTNLDVSIVGPAINTDFDLLFTHDGSIGGTSGSAVVGYLNGSVATPTVQSSGSLSKSSDAADPLRFGTTSGYLPGGGSFDGYIYEVLIWNRVLSAGEAAALSANPYQVYAATAFSRRAMPPQQRMC